MTRKHHCILPLLGVMIEFCDCCWRARPILKVEPRYDTGDELCQIIHLRNDSNL